ncbi:hypothetical protein DIPPA_00930 [Diplonema papillatum]|nr:hypothetical protein DIPPA_00930 [Diplonema papillatum]
MNRGVGGSLVPSGGECLLLPAGLRFEKGGHGLPLAEERFFVLVAGALDLGQELLLPAVLGGVLLPLADDDAAPALVLLVLDAPQRQPGSGRPLLCLRHASPLYGSV